jgi:hypothetical protein
MKIVTNGNSNKSLYINAVVTNELLMHGKTPLQPLVYSYKAMLCKDSIGSK